MVSKDRLLIETRQDFTIEGDPRQIEQLVRLSREVGRDVASAQEARQQRQYALLELLELEKVTVDAVEDGWMTKDLALLVGPDQKWLTTMGYLEKVDEYLNKALAG